MRKERLKKKLITVLQMSFVLLVCCLCTVLAGGRCADALEEKPQPSEEEYGVQYDNAVKLADMLVRKYPDKLNNKLYTAEQEEELQALVDSVCGSAKNDRQKVGNLLACIFQKLDVMN